MANLRLVTVDGGAVEMTAQEREDLAVALRGDLVDPGHPQYEEARLVWNGMIDKRPGLIIRCRGAADVIQAVNLVRERGLQFSVRGGGHNVAGKAMNDGGVVIDLSVMSAVRVDPAARRVFAQGGATLGDIDAETAPFGLAVPQGVVSATGVGGLCLHGGYGWLSRRFGLTLDNLLAADVVTADGSLHKVDAFQEPDLFWALRGGGGNFGVVTGFEFLAHPVPHEVSFLMPFFPLDQAAQVLRGLNRLAPETPPELVLLATLWTVPDLEDFPAQRRGEPALIVLGCWSGPPAEAAKWRAAVAELGEPLADMSQALPFVAAQQMLDDDYPDGRRYYWKSQYLTELSDAVIERAIRATRERPSPLSSIDIWYGDAGNLGGVAPEATPFWHRSQPFLFNIETNWDDPADDAANLAWTRELFGDVKAMQHGGTYLNFPGFAEEGEAMVRQAYGPNYERLAQVKAVYDPDNLFQGNFNIAPQG